MVAFKIVEVDRAVKGLDLEACICVYNVDGKFLGVLIAVLHQTRRPLTC